MYEEAQGISRREFMSRTGQTVGGMLVGAGLATAGSNAAQAGQPRAAGAPRPAVSRAPIPRFGFTTYTWGKDWDIPTLIANCTKAKVFGVELRMSGGYAHGVELDITAEKRAEVKKRFADSPVKVVGLATSERFDVLDPKKVKEAVESSKGYLKLSADVGSTGIRVFPNDYHKEVPREQTIKQIAEALNEVGAFAKDCGQQVRLEAHGSAGDLPSLRAILDLVKERSVRVALNSDRRDTQGKGFEYNFNLVKDFLAGAIHLHDLKDKEFPYQLQTNLLVRMQWDGWALLEQSDKVEDRVQALTEQRELWDQLRANALKG